MMTEFTQSTNLSNFAQSTMLRWLSSVTIRHSRGTKLVLEILKSIVCTQSGHTTDPNHNVSVCSVTSGKYKFACKQITCNMDACSLSLIPGFLPSLLPTSLKESSLTVHGLEVRQVISCQLKFSGCK